MQYKKTGICDISKRIVRSHELIEGKNIRPHLVALIKSEYPDFNDNSVICVTELNKFRKQYLENIITDDIGALSKLEQEVIQSISQNELLSSENTDFSAKHKLVPTFGERLADKIAEFGGSWFFIISFFCFCFFWMAINLFPLVTKVFDPYPFILLNLALSCVAAIQAPFIMMSQNRQEAKDRIRSEHDYKINLKAELEIRLLHEKVDYLLAQQNKRFIEIQQIQMDLMEDILEGVRKDHKASGSTDAAKPHHDTTKTQS